MISHAWLALLCSKVYETADTHLLTINEVDCLVMEADEYVVLAFRGTEASAAWPVKWSWQALSNTRDIIRDLRFVPWKEPGTCNWVHKGFGISAQWWFEEFVSELPKGKPVYLTGHSLGAGIAPLVARLLHGVGYSVAEVVLFGEPGGHYGRSASRYRELGIKTTSYRHRKDWIRWAGVGAKSVPPTVLNPGRYSAWESHDIDLYYQTLMSNPYADSTYL